MPDWAGAIMWPRSCADCLATTLIVYFLYVHLACGSN